jgi:hypothetical protein
MVPGAPESVPSPPQPPLPSAAPPVGAAPRRPAPAPPAAAAIRVPTAAAAAAAAAVRVPAAATSAWEPLATSSRRWSAPAANLSSAAAGAGTLNLSRVRKQMVDEALASLLLQ